MIKVYFELASFKRQKNEVLCSVYGEFTLIEC